MVSVTPPFSTVTLSVATAGSTPGRANRTVAEPSAAVVASAVTAVAWASAFATARITAPATGLPWSVSVSLACTGSPGP